MSVGTPVRAGAIVWFLLPLVPLVLWAFADTWRAPSVLPTQWGTTGWRQASSAGAGAAFARSVVLSLTVAALATPAGAMTARALTFGHVRRRPLVAAVVLAPLVLPPFAVVMGLDVLLLRLHVPAVLGVVTILTVAALPYTTFVMYAAYAGYDTGYEDEARTLGASPAAVLGRIHLPLVARAMATAAFLAALVGWSDYIVTVIIGGGRLVTYPVLLASAASTVGNESMVGVLSVLAVGPPLLLLLALSRPSRLPRPAPKENR